MPELVVQGLELMLVGMGTVFLFLTALVLATIAMSRLVARFTPAAVVADTDTVSSEEVAAISAAIAMHRRNRH
jgi:oxaloacetate decarboxylase (Na+ extruding) subunit gamma